MAFFDLGKHESADRFAEMFAYLTDEELVEKGFNLGREENFERYLLPHQREELRGIKVQLLSRIRKKNTPR